jgi:hypothetical protein
MSSPAAIALGRHRVDTGNATALAHLPAPAWCFIEVPRRFESSTALRNGAP